MSWLVPSVIATLTGSVILSLVFFYLYHVHRRDYLGIWSLSWTVYTLRFVLILISQADLQTSVLQPLIHLVTLASGFVLLWGTHRFARRRFNPLLLVLGGLTAGWIVVGTVARVSFLTMTSPAFLTLGAVYVWTGWTILRTEIGRAHV